jgi:hypothetical protein
MDALTRKHSIHFVEQEYEIDFPVSILEKKQQWPLIK